MQIPNWLLVESKRRIKYKSGGKKRPITSSKTRSRKEENKVNVTYHCVHDFDAFDIIGTLAPGCDILGHTVHGYEGDFIREDD